MLSVQMLFLFDGINITEDRRTYRQLSLLDSVIEMEDSEEQSNEVLVLESIYSDGLFTWEKVSNGIRGSVSVSVDLPNAVEMVHKGYK